MKNIFFLLNKKILIPCSSFGIGVFSAIKASRFATYIILFERDKQRIEQTCYYLEKGNN